MKVAQIAGEVGVIGWIGDDQTVMLSAEWAERKGSAKIKFVIRTLAPPPTPFLCHPLPVADRTVRAVTHLHASPATIPLGAHQAGPPAIVSEVHSDRSAGVIKLAPFARCVCWSAVGLRGVCHDIDEAGEQERVSARAGQGGARTRRVLGGWSPLRLSGSGRRTRESGSEHCSVQQGRGGLRPRVASSPARFHDPRSRRPARRRLAAACSALALTGISTGHCEH